MAIEKFKGRNGNYYFRVKSANGQIVMQSQGYSNQVGADKGISSVRENAKYNAFEIRKSRTGDYYFVMKAKNGKIIGKSEMYKSKSGAKKGVDAVIQNSKGTAVLI